MTTRTILTLSLTILFLSATASRASSPQSFSTWGDPLYPAATSSAAVLTFERSSRADLERAIDRQLELRPVRVQGELEAPAVQPTVRIGCAADTAPRLRFDEDLALMKSDPAATASSPDASARCRHHCAASFSQRSWPPGPVHDE